MKKYLKYAFEFYTWLSLGIVSGFLIGFIFGGGEINLNKYHLKYQGLISQFLTPPKK